MCGSCTVLSTVMCVDRALYRVQLCVWIVHCTEYSYVCGSCTVLSTVMCVDRALY